MIIGYIRTLIARFTCMVCRMAGKSRILGVSNQFLSERLSGQNQFLLSSCHTQSKICPMFLFPIILCQLPVKEVQIYLPQILPLLCLVGVMPAAIQATAAAEPPPRRRRVGARRPQATAMPAIRRRCCWAFFIQVNVKLPCLKVCSAQCTDIWTGEMPGQTWIICVSLGTMSNCQREIVTRGRFIAF